MLATGCTSAFVNEGFLFDFHRLVPIGEFKARNMQITDGM